MLHSECIYNQLIEMGQTHEKASGVLPNSYKAEVLMTLTLEYWRKFFTYWCSKTAHLKMRQLAIPMLLHFRKIPIIFDEIRYDTSFDVRYFAKNHCDDPVTK